MSVLRIKLLLKNRRFAGDTKSSKKTKKLVKNLNFRRFVATKKLKNKATTKKSAPLRGAKKLKKTFQIVLSSLKKPMFLV